MSKGIDVSKHQGKIDWKRVKASGVDFAVLRAGYGKYDNQKDEFFEENYKNAKQEGIKVGAYHYSYAKSVEDAKKEAEIFLKWIDGKQLEYPVAFDVEEKNQSERGKQFVSDIIRAFCETVERAGYYVCIYANKYWLENYIDDDCKKKYDTWLAQWRHTAEATGFGSIRRRAVLTEFRADATLTRAIRIIQKLSGITGLTASRSRPQSLHPNPFPSLSKRVFRRE